MYIFIDLLPQGKHINCWKIIKNKPAKTTTQNLWKLSQRNWANRKTFHCENILILVSTASLSDLSYDLLPLLLQVIMTECRQEDKAPLLSAPCQWLLCLIWKSRLPALSSSDLCFTEAKFQMCLTKMSQAPLFH